MIEQVLRLDDEAGLGWLSISWSWLLVLTTHELYDTRLNYRRELID